MGIFDFFKTKVKKESELKENEKLSSQFEKSIEEINNNKYHKPSNWTSNYIYGFINNNPMQKISNHDDLIEIIKNTVGPLWCSFNIIKLRMIWSLLCHFDQREKSHNVIS